MFLEAIFSNWRTLFLELSYKIFVIALYDIIGLQKFHIVFLPIIIQNSVRFVICTGVKFELHCSQPIRIE